MTHMRFESDNDSVWSDGVRISSTLSIWGNHLIGTVRVDDPGVIQCRIQVAIHETGSRPQNRGKGGSRIVCGSSEKRLQRRFARRSSILDSGNLIPSHFCDTSFVSPVLINDFESLRLADGVLRSPRRVTT